VAVWGSCGQCAVDYVVAGSEQGSCWAKLLGTARVRVRMTRTCGPMYTGFHV